MSDDEKTRMMVELCDVSCADMRHFLMMRYCVYGMVYDPWGTTTQANSGNFSLEERLGLGRKPAEKDEDKP